METETFATGAQEVCETEMFEAECQEGHVILMQQAHYGRMKFGRCVDRDYGYLGCDKDVLHIADRWCSGRQSCEIPVPNSAFRSTNPCPKDLKPYFEAVYTCVAVEIGPSRNCNGAGITKVHNPDGYLSKSIAIERGFGTEDCPWFIEAQPGQRINVTLYDFSMAAWEHTNLVASDGVCRVTAVMREKQDTRGVTVCSADSRMKHVYTSEGHVLEVRILGSSSKGDDKGYFLLKYETLGCATPRATQGMRVVRKGSIADIICEEDDNIRWRLVCQRHTWTGEQGNCTHPPGKAASTSVNGKVGGVMLGSVMMPFEVSIAVIVAIALAIGIIILAFGLICLKWRLNQRHARKQHQKNATAARPANAYTDKSRRGHRMESVESLPPPPPPELDNEALIENEYAYIAELPPPPPPLPPTPDQRPRKPERSFATGSACGSPHRTAERTHSGSSQGSPHHFPSVGYEMNKSSRNGYVPRVKEVKPPKVPNGIPVVPANSQILPKLLAHECALSVRTPEGQSPKRRSSRPRSRQPSDSDTPTYFELDPELDPASGSRRSSRGGEVPDVKAIAVRRSSRGGEDTLTYTLDKSYERPGANKPQHTL